MVTRDFLLLVFNDVILLQLQPFVISYVENNEIFEMERTYVKCFVSVVHDSLVNLDLVKQLAVVLVVIELDGLDEIVRIMVVVFICLYEWNIALLRLNDVKCHVPQVTLIIHGDNLARHLDNFLDTARRVLVLVEVIRQLEVASSRILYKLPLLLNVLFKTVNSHASFCIFRSTVNSGRL